MKILNYNDFILINEKKSNSLTENDFLSLLNDNCLTYINNYDYITKIYSYRNNINENYSLENIRNKNDDFFNLLNNLPSWIDIFDLNYGIPLTTGFGNYEIIPFDFNHNQSKTTILLNYQGELDYLFYKGFSKLFSDSDISFFSNKKLFKYWLNEYLGIKNYDKLKYIQDLDYINSTPENEYKINSLIRLFKLNKKDFVSFLDSFLNPGYNNLYLEEYNKHFSINKNISGFVNSNVLLLNSDFRYDKKINKIIKK